MKLLIKAGRVVDPSQNLDKVMDIEPEEKVNNKMGFSK